MSTLQLETPHWISPEPEPMPVAAAALTVAVHVAFAAVLFLNMSWQHKIQDYASVKLWQTMPVTSVKSTKTAKPAKGKTAGQAGKAAANDLSYHIAMPSDLPRPIKISEESDVAVYDYSPKPRLFRSSPARKLTTATPNEMIAISRKRRKKGMPLAVAM